MLRPKSRLPPIHTCADGSTGNLKRTEPWFLIASFVFALTSWVVTPVLHGFIPAWLARVPPFLGQLIGVAFISSLLVVAVGREYSRQIYVCKNCGQRIVKASAPIPTLVKVGMIIFIGVIGLFLFLLALLIATF
jgi:hypothetical protein